MRYSLLSRFEGGLLGSLMGELCIHHFSPQKALIPLEPKLSRWGQTAQALLERLSATERLSEQDWIDIDRAHPFLGDWRNTPSSSAIALATLPLAFLWHDRPSRLHEQLASLGAMGQPSPAWLDGVLLWTDAIALALSEKLDARAAIAQLLSGRQLLQTPLKQQLEQLQACLAQGFSLTGAVKFSQSSATSPPRQGSLASTTPIALALACFQETPEDFSVCVRRAAHISSQPALSAALAGAIAGTYNSTSGLPIPWRLAWQTYPLSQPLSQAVKRLFALWCGAYDPVNFAFSPATAVALPQVMQPRACLRPISQRLKE
jgi:ADP-ribosylglycohydrolase